jgi:RIO1 family
LQKDNVLFLRFLGDEGWPAPQLRELDIKKGSKKWTALYEQTMEALQLLYCDACLVHGDLSEYNIMVCPRRFLKRVEDEVEVCHGDENEKLTDGENAKAEGDQNMAGGDESEDLKPAAVSTTQPGQSTAEATKPQSSEGNKTRAATPDADDDSLHIALIDFGQAVDRCHPGSEEMLKRDVTRVKEFFDRMGITTIVVEAAMAFVQTKGAALR